MALIVRQLEILKSLKSGINSVHDSRGKELVEKKDNVLGKNTN